MYMDIHKYILMIYYRHAYVVGRVSCFLQQWVEKFEVLLLTSSVLPSYSIPAQTKLIRK